MAENTVPRRHPAVAAKSRTRRSRRARVESLPPLLPSTDTSQALVPSDNALALLPNKRGKRWLDSSIADGDLTIWEIIKRYKKPTDPNAKRAKRPEEILEEQRERMRAELGSNVDESLLNMFAAAEPATTSAPPSTSDDPFSFLSSAINQTNDDDFFGSSSTQRDDVFQLAIHDGSRGAIPPFAGAYRYTKPRNWSDEDELVFYRAVAMHKSDLMLIGGVLPHYTAKQIKSKYTRELKQGNRRLLAAMEEDVDIDTKDFERIRGPIDKSTHVVAGEVRRPSELEITKRLPRSKDEKDPMATNIFDDMFGDGDGSLDEAKIERVQELPEISDDFASAIFGL